MWPPATSLCLPSLHIHTQYCFSRELQFLHGQSSGHPPPAVATSLAGGRVAVCQGQQPAPAATCSRHRVWISSSCLTRHRQAGRRLIFRENAASIWGRKTFLKHKFLPYPLQILSLDTKVKVFLPYCFWLPNDFLIFSLPPKGRQGCCLSDELVL